MGDAQKLEDILADASQVDPSWVKDTTKVVICVGNTMGIMPPEIGLNAHKQMKLVGGTEGAFATVYWNGNRFGDALQNFYLKNPQLCGEFSGEHIDLKGTNLKTPQAWRTPPPLPKPSSRSPRVRPRALALALSLAPTAGLFDALDEARGGTRHHRASPRRRDH